MNSIKNTTAARGQKAVYRKGEERNVVCWAIVEKLETASGDVERVDRIVGMVINGNKVVPAPTIEGFVKYIENGSSTSGEVETRDLLFGNE